jgi:hypothetical protein
VQNLEMLAILYKQTMNLAGTLCDAPPHLKGQSYELSGAELRQDIFSSVRTLAFEKQGLVIQ